MVGDQTGILFHRFNQVMCEWVGLTLFCLGTALFFFSRVKPFSSSKDISDSGFSFTFVSIKHFEVCLCFTPLTWEMSMSALSTSPLDKEGGVTRLLVACEHVVCQYGRCVLANGEPGCECTLGYTGDSCDETINEALSVPLTVGVLVVIVGFVVLFFAMAFFRQRLKAKKRKKAAEESLMRNGAHI